MIRGRSGRSRDAVCALHRADARGDRCFRLVWRTGLTVGRTSRLNASPWRSAQPVPWSCGGTSVARSALSCSTSRVSGFCVPGIKPLHRLALDPSHAVCSVSQTTKSISLGSVEWRARCMLARANSASAPRSEVTLTRVRIECYRRRCADTTLHFARVSAFSPLSRGTGIKGPTALLGA